jgi:HSP20 family protein
MRDRQHPFESMERLFEQMRTEMFSDRTPALESGGHADGWDASVSIEERDDGFAVLADLPGFDREELTISLHEDRLHLDGEHEVGDGASYRSRRVSERITLPVTPDPEDVTATYHNGVLEIRVAVEDDDGEGIHIDIE